MKKFFPACFVLITAICPHVDCVMAASPVQQAYVKPSNTGVNDEFGAAVAVSSDTVVVGAPKEGSDATGVNGDQNNNNRPFSGAAYVFVRQGSNWVQQAYLKASNNGGAFGGAVAIWGDTIVVGAKDEAGNGSGVNGIQTNYFAPGAGAAYVFVRTGTNWTQQAYLKATVPDLYFYFGASVAIHSNTIVVGSYREGSSATDVGGNEANRAAAGAGAVFVFVRNGNVWSKQAYLKASNTGVDDEFGLSVSVSGDTVVVGAHQEDSNGAGLNSQTNNLATDAGAAYIFVRNGTAWSPQAYLKASNVGPSDWFGKSVAVSGETILVGAPGEDSNAVGVNGNQTNNAATDSGAAYVFTRSGSNWSQQAYLKAYYVFNLQQFGGSVALSGDIALTGAPIEKGDAIGVNGTNTIDPDLSYAGAATAFVRSGTNWSQRAYIKASNTDQADEFGGSVAVSEGTAVVGAFHEDSAANGLNGSQTNNLAANAGAAYLFAGLELALPTAPRVSPITLLAGGSVQLNFTNASDTSFTILASTNVALPLVNWTVLGAPVEISPGVFQYVDSQATNFTRRFYVLRSP